MADQAYAGLLVAAAFGLTAVLLGVVITLIRGRGPDEDEIEAAERRTTRGRRRAR